MWQVTGYYNDTVEYPKVPRTLALQTVHASDSSMKAELYAYSMRDDIGQIDVHNLHNLAKSFGYTNGDPPVGLLK